MNNGIGPEKHRVCGGDREGIRVTKDGICWTRSVTGWAPQEEMTGWLLKGKVFYKGSSLVK